MIAREARAKGRCGCSAPALATETGTLEEVVIAFVWFGAGGAAVVVSALAVVKNFACRKKEHAEFEYEFALLEARFICCGEAILIYRVSDCVRPAETFEQVWVECTEALVFSNGAGKIAGYGAAAKEKLDFAVSKERRVMDEIGALAELTGCETVSVNIELRWQRQVCIWDFAVLMAFNVEDVRRGLIFTKQAEDLEDYVVF